MKWNVLGLSLLTICIVGIGAGACAHAQSISARSDECAQSIQIVSSGVDDTTGKAWGDIPFCGDAGVKAIVKVLTEIRLSRESVPQLDRFHIGMIRDPRVFDAAFALAQDDQSPVVNREAALEIMGRQHELFIGGISLGGECNLRFGGEYMGLPPLVPPNRNDSARFAHLLDSMAHGLGATDPRLQGSSACIRAQLTGKLPS